MQKQKPQITKQSIPKKNSCSKKFQQVCIADFHLLATRNLDLTK
jgi:hypothetical protein